MPESKYVKISSFTIPTNYSFFILKSYIQTPYINVLDLSLLNEFTGKLCGLLKKFSDRLSTRSKYKDVEISSLFP
jgi:hypothetical protein